MNEKNEIRREVIENLGVLSENPATGWRKEVKIVSWNGHEGKVDIRDWSADNRHCAKGLTFTDEEVNKLLQILMGYKGIKPCLCEDGNCRGEDENRDGFIDVDLGDATEGFVPF